MITTIDKGEISHFDNYSHEWWDETGSFRALHKMNPVRLEFIKSLIPDLTNMDVLDVGCGGGLLCEPLARLRANVTGVDASSQNIEVAKAHAGDLTINYINCAVEDLDQQYDAVFALEIIEHVNSPKQFLEACLPRVKPGGLLFISTINRTMKAYLLGVLLAENVLKWAPKGTHNWQKFVRPTELRRWSPGFTVKDLKGINYSVLQDEWCLGESRDINYIMCLVNT